jgi:hypothetical protein
LGEFAPLPSPTRPSDDAKLRLDRACDLPEE